MNLTEHSIPKERPMALKPKPRSKSIEVLTTILNIKAINRIAYTKKNRFRAMNQKNQNK